MDWKPQTTPKLYVKRALRRKTSASGCSALTMFVYIANRTYSNQSLHKKYQIHNIVVLTSHTDTMTTMESSNLTTASTYINNLLLSRGLLRNGKPIEFAKPENTAGGVDATMVKIMNLVHDLILRRDVRLPTDPTLRAPRHLLMKRKARGRHPWKPVSNPTNFAINICAAGAICDTTRDSQRRP